MEMMWTITLVSGRRILLQTVSNVPFKSANVIPLSTIILLPDGRWRMCLHQLHQNGIHVQVRSYGLASVLFHDTSLYRGDVCVLNDIFVDIQIYPVHLLQDGLRGIFNISKLAIYRILLLVLLQLRIPYR